MAKITSRQDCGNSPKMEFIKKFNIAFANADIDFLSAAVSEDFVWNRIGGEVIEGKENFTTALHKMKEYKVSELILDQILSHGKEGAANGIMILEDGSHIAFGDFYLFSSAKGDQFSSMTSYVIEL